MVDRCLYIYNIYILYKHKHTIRTRFSVLHTDGGWQIVTAGLSRIRKLCQSSLDLVEQQGI